MFVGPAWPAPREKSVATVIEFRLQEQLCECRVSLVGPTIIQGHLRIARKLDFTTAWAVIDERDEAYLGICVRHNTNGTASFDLAIPSLKHSAVGVKLGFVFIGGLA
jgi:hypothetical protein